MTEPSFTGFNRKRKTSRRVRIGDRLAATLITIGGFGTIFAIALVCGFLVWVVLPLFGGAEVEAQRDLPLRATLLHQQVDEDRQTAWQVATDGKVRFSSLLDGEELANDTVFAAPWQAIQAHGQAILLANNRGQARLLRIGFEQRSLAFQSGPLQEVEVGSGIADGESWFQRTVSGWNRKKLLVDEGEPFDIGPGTVLAADFAAHANGTVVAFVLDNGRLVLRSLVEEENEITEEIEIATIGVDRTLAALGVPGPPPVGVAVFGTGTGLLLLWDDGRFVRLNLYDFDNPEVAETGSVLSEETALPEAGVTIGKSRFLLGRRTLLVADDRGRVHALFNGKTGSATDARGSDGAQLELVRTFAPPASGSPVGYIAPATRTRLFAVGHDDGLVRVWHGTSERLVAEFVIPGGGPIQHVAFAPREDAIYVATDRALHGFSFAAGHPEVTLASLVLPVWYENLPAPEHSWQSTGGTDDFEPKLGLWPLIFGTLKGTLYCLLFGVPLALLAAIYTSEFLKPRHRSRVKPLVESMASLPSVVLGFLAALVFAPFVERWLTTLLLSVLTVPLVWLLGSQLLQLLTPQSRLRAERLRLLFVVLVSPVGILLAVWVAGLVETWMFGGSLKGWLSAQQDQMGSAFGGFFLVLLPFGALLATFLVGRSGLAAGHPTAGLIRTGTGLALALAATTLVALGLTAIGLDLRGPIVGTYVQRNALVVGFVMGFAVIPIIYTIAEDALAAVPEHLRAASLGAGATPWQTATRIVLPTAMSGIFSAVMVGLGRAVGETMIVLMAAGNTPVLELNPFNGFRTLSANIAVELPEAVRDSTHYRTLYLAALVLFAMTFILNSGAEIVRQRFRKRAWQL